MLKLIIGNRAYSSWSMRGWLALKHSGEEFEELVVPMFDDEWDQRREGDEFAPSLGKVPILWDGDCVVWDSLAIVEFLADRVGRDRYWPADDAAVSYHLVLTKADKVKPTDLATTLEKTAEEARKHPAAHPAIFTTSSETGSGIAELRMAILEAALS